MWKALCWTWARISDASVLIWLAGIPVSAGASYWAWVSQWGYLPIALTALGVFVVTVWGINGIVWLKHERRPSKARITFDYSYALAVETVSTSYDPTNSINNLEVRLVIRNHANGPLKILVERLHITIEDRYWTTPPNTINLMLPRVAALTIFPGGGFSKEAVDKFAATTRGRLELSFLYGHPEDKFSRRATKTLRLDVFKRADDQGKITVLVNWLIEAEADVAI